MGEPDLFELLFFNICGRIISEVVTSALELVRCREFGLLLAIRVECLEGWLVRGALRLLERPRSVRKFDRAGHFCRCCRQSSISALGLLNRYIVDRAKLGCHQAMTVLCLGHNG